MARPTGGCDEAEGRDGSAAADSGDAQAEVATQAGEFQLPCLSHDLMEGFSFNFGSFLRL